jgi:hypothetical protein
MCLMFSSSGQLRRLRAPGPPEIVRPPGPHWRGRLRSACPGRRAATRRYRICALAPPPTASHRLDRSGDETVAWSVHDTRPRQRVWHECLRRCLQRRTTFVYGACNHAASLPTRCSSFRGVREHSPARIVTRSTKPATRRSHASVTSERVSAAREISAQLLVRRSYISSASRDISRASRTVVSGRDEVRGRHALGIPRREPVEEARLRTRNSRSGGARPCAPWRSPSPVVPRAPTAAAVSRSRAARRRLSSSTCRASAGGMFGLRQALPFEQQLGLGDSGLAVRRRGLVGTRPQVIRPEGVVSSRPTRPAIRCHRNPFVKSELLAPYTILRVSHRSRRTSSLSSTEATESLRTAVACTRRVRGRADVARTAPNPISEIGRGHALVAPAQQPTLDGRRPAGDWGACAPHAREDEHPFDEVFAAVEPAPDLGGTTPSAASLMTRRSSGRRSAELSTRSAYRHHWWLVPPLSPVDAGS